MSYQITITRIGEKTVTRKGEHTVIAEVPWPDDDLSDASKYYQSADEFLKTSPTKKVYGYAPDKQVVEKTETEVLKQHVEELDLAAVIKAVNGL